MKKISMLGFIMSLLGKKVTQEKKTEDTLEYSMEKRYEEYLNKPSEYHDKVIKRMYRDTDYANETPERLREILRSQFADTGIPQ